MNHPAEDLRRAMAVNASPVDLLQRGYTATAELAASRPALPITLIRALSALAAGLPTLRQNENR